MLVPIPGRDRIWLRRYGGKCRGPYSYHNAKVLIAANAPERASSDAATPEELADPRWPTKCDYCEHVFSGEARQIFCQSLYRRADTGEETTLHEAPPGAMWDAVWFRHPQHKGPDGRCLVVRCPDGHDWMIDSRASNCTLPKDNVHKCWVRHGEPPNITVDKKGVTCSAGAGSIQTPKWHGFLRDGFLVA